MSLAHKFEVGGSKVRWNPVSGLVRSFAMCKMFGFYLVKSDYGASASERNIREKKIIFHGSRFLSHRDMTLAVKSDVSIVYD